MVYHRDQRCNYPKNLTPNNPLMDGTHHNLSSFSHLILTKYNTMKNEAKTSTSQSQAALAKLTFYWMAPLENSMWAIKEASFAQPIPNKARKALKGHIPTPKIMSEFNLGVISHLKSGMITKLHPIPHNILS
jgi:hypothetical protein